MPTVDQERERNGSTETATARFLSTKLQNLNGL